MRFRTTGAGLNGLSVAQMNAMNAIKAWDIGSNGGGENSVGLLLTSRDQTSFK